MDDRSLEPEASKVFTAEYTVTQKDIQAGSVKNVATADGDNPSDDPTDPGNGDTEDPTEKPLVPPDFMVPLGAGLGGLNAGETIE